MYYLLWSSCGGLLPLCKYSVCLKKKVQKRAGLFRVASVISPQSRASSNHQLWYYTQCLGLQDNLERRCKRVGRVLSGRWEETERENQMAESWEVGNPDAGPRAHGYGSWLVLRSSLYSISRRRDKSSAALNVKVVSVGGRGLLCAGDYSVSTWSKCQIGSWYCRLVGPSPFFFLSFYASPFTFYFPAPSWVLPNLCVIT